ncbi:MAG: hypothetical protein ABI560_14710, partial [Myxococcales bacterium]
CCGSGNSRRSRSNTGGARVRLAQPLFALTEWATVRRGTSAPSTRARACAGATALTPPIA